MNNLHSTIAGRKSALSFNQKPISKEDITLLFEAARWAPSSYNEQPWRFYYASSENMLPFNKLLKCLAPGNSEWAKNSSLLIIAVAKEHLTLNNKINNYALHDTGLSTANLIFQAESMGFITHIMGGFDKSEAIQTLNLPDNLLPVTAIAIGYEGDLTDLSDSNKKRATSTRTRKPLNEISFEIS